MSQKSKLKLGLESQSIGNYPELKIDEKSGKNRHEISQEERTLKIDLKKLILPSYWPHMEAMNNLAFKHSSFSKSRPTRK